MNSDEITERALREAPMLSDAVMGLLKLLGDVTNGHDRYSQEMGTAPQRGLIAHLAGLEDEEKLAWYRTAQDVGLTKRHLGHLIKRINEGALDKTENRLDERMPWDGEDFEPYDPKPDGSLIEYSPTDFTPYVYEDGVTHRISNPYEEAVLVIVGDGQYLDDPCDHWAMTPFDGGEAVFSVEPGTCCVASYARSQPNWIKNFGYDPAPVLYGEPGDGPFIEVYIEEALNLHRFNHSKYMLFTNILKDKYLRFVYQDRDLLDLIAVFTPHLRRAA